MSYTVCHNEECSRNIELPGNNEPPAVTLNIPHYDDLGSSPEFVRRYLYRTLVSDGDGTAHGVDTYLCDVCHAAVQLVRKPGIFNAKREKT